MSELILIAEMSVLAYTITLMYRVILRTHETLDNIASCQHCKQTPTIES
jgi:hypothetical protein